MSYYLVDLDKDINFNFENLIIDSKIDLENNGCKYLIYYLDKNEPKELFVKLPKLRLTYDWKNFKYNQLKIRITPKYEKTNNMVNFFIELEDTIKSHKYFNKKSFEFISLIIKEKCNYIKTFFQENKTKISPKMKINEFKVNGEIEMVIRLNNIWKKDNKVGLSSQLYQIKYYPPPEDININFIDEYEEKPAIVQPIIKPPTSILPPQISNFLQIPSEQPKLLINADLLKSVKLKSVEKN